ncbi:hypothetical protein [Solicola gregarius]|uniref:Uncharacterized protein n=1 Tax=Solicola gregarius TaxID=2908642 RepID=A0AA46TLH7_9ACTN|nr:hypothetical protein [Solicola gregarius]UYM07338.1 hypothetical protein L0C25_09770 [Solicola gregarius]
MNTDEAVAAGDPYPQQSVEELSLRAASQELMEEVMATPTKPSTPVRPAIPHRPRWLAPAVAAVAVAAVVAGAVAVIAPQSEHDPRRAESAGAPSLGADTAPPTGADLRYVVLRADDWRVTNATDGEHGGSLSWSNGASTLELGWYERGDHQTYLDDRDDDGDYEKERVSILGQTGWEFRTRLDARRGLIDPVLGKPGSSDHEGPGNGDHALRVMTILPPVGDWFLELDATVPDAAAYRDLVSSLQRVDRRTWLEAMDSSVIRPSEAESFLDDVGRDVPMPPGVTVTPEDLRLPQDAYAARAAFVEPVMCGWAEEYVGGDDHALNVLRESKDWRVMDALAAEGDLPSVFRDDVRILARNPGYEGWREMWGC